MHIGSKGIDMKIDSNALKQLRKDKEWSIADLSKRAKGVSEATIIRIENQQTKRNNASVFERLARALQTDQETLSGEKALPDAPDAKPGIEKSQIRVRLSNEARNSFVFVASRYGVSPQKIIEIAPLLFHIVAGESLLQRAKMLADLEAKRSALESPELDFSHISGRLTDDIRFDELVSLEEKSIGQNDLFGLIIDGDQSCDDPRPYSYNHETENPFARYLARKLEKLSELAGWQGNLDGIDEDFTSKFSICRPEFEAFCEGDSVAADLLIDGVIGLYEIPAELRPRGCAAERNTWIKNTASTKFAEFSELVQELEI